jgi:hypothetical protein
MNKKHRKKNNKKKTNNVLPILSTTVSLSSTSEAQLGVELESLRHSTLSKTKATSVAVAAAMKMEDNLCQEIDDLAFSGPGNPLNKNDYHAWCVDDEDLVCNYSAQQLVKNVSYGTGDIICRPFSAHLIPQWLVRCDKIYDAFQQDIAAKFGAGDVESTKAVLLSIINTPLFPSKICYIHAKLLHESNPKKYSLVIGSLGFRRADGRIYWEHG